MANGYARGAPSIITTKMPRENVMKLIIFVVAVLGIAIMAESANAEATGATKEKCTCDLVQESEPNKGAEVVNGAVCVRHDDPNREWCDIFVKYLEDQAETGNYIATFINSSVPRPSDPTELRKELLLLFDAYAERASISADYVLDRKDLETKMGVFYGLAQKCVVNFAEGVAVTKADEGFSCSVGSESG